MLEVFQFLHYQVHVLLLLLLQQAAPFLLAGVAVAVAHEALDGGGYPTRPPHRLLLFFDQLVSLLLGLGEGDDHLLGAQLAFNLVHPLGQISRVFDVILDVVGIPELDLVDEMILLDVLLEVAFDPSVELLDPVQLAQLDHLPLWLVLSVDLISGFSKVVKIRLDGVFPVFRAIAFD